MPKPSVLLIGSRGKLRRRLEHSLQSAGCQVTTASDGSSAVQKAVNIAPDIVMVGQDLAEYDGLEVCRRIRQVLRPGRPPVFLLTPDCEDDQWDIDQLVDGNPGHRDWNLVEYGFGALLAWIEASGGVHEQIRHEGLELDRRRFLAMVNGRDIKLTATEFRLLWALASEPGKAFDRQRLAQACSGENRRQMRTIDVHIKAIRDKLGDRSTLVQTVHGVGYRFRDTVLAGKDDGLLAPSTCERQVSGA